MGSSWRCTLASDTQPRRSTFQTQLGRFCARVWQSSVRPVMRGGGYCGLAYAFRVCRPAASRGERGRALGWK